MIGRGSSAVLERTAPQERLSIGEVEERFTIDDVTRRKFLASVMAVALLSACGDDDDDAPSTPTAIPTRVFTDDTGREVTIPQHPTRIIALNDYNSGGPLLSLGAPVVGTADRGGVFAEHLQNRFDLTNVTQIGPHYEPDLELIISLTPDLIVGLADHGQPDMEPAIAEALSAIAPIVWIDDSRPQDEVMRAYGEITGTSDEVDRQRAAYDERAKALSAALGNPAALSYASFEFYDNTASVQSPLSPDTIVAVCVKLGLTPIPLAADLAARGETRTDISAENFAQLQADMLFYATYGEGAEEQLLSGATFQALPAARAKQTYRYPDLGQISYDAMQAALDFLEPLLLSADPDVVDETAP